MEFDSEGFIYPIVDINKCINCEKCVSSCPTINQRASSVNPILYGCQSDNQTRKKSSSGGVFYELASTIIKDGGVVFGAKFNDNWEVVHDYSTKLNSIKQFQKSKYVQSRTDDCFIKVKDFLTQGKVVLFSGTPCQIAGLKKFLHKPYGNLITIDIICHGVPSPIVWRKYLRELTKKLPNGINSITGIDFRDKTVSWRNYKISIYSRSKNHNRVYSKDIYQDPYMLFFLDNVTLRPSCHNCHFRNHKSNSDLTLGDFWGVENVLKEMDDEIGTSLVLLNTTKGKVLFERINLERKKIVQYEDIIKYNPSLVKSYKRNKFRAIFFLLNKHIPISKIFSYYIGNATIAERLLYRAIRLINHI